MDFPFCCNSQLNPNNNKLRVSIPVIIQTLLALRDSEADFKRLNMILTKITLSIPSTTSKMIKIKKLMMLSVLNNGPIKTTDKN